MSIHKEVKKVTTHTLLKMKANGEKIAMLTAYDFSFAKIFDAAGIDVLLVGDSAGNVIAGYETTVPVTLEQIIYHAQCVVRGVNRSLVVVDMPFGTYQSNSDIALASAIRIMKETGGHSIKMEGGEEIIESVKKIVSTDGGLVNIHGRYCSHANTRSNSIPKMSDRRCWNGVGESDLVKMSEVI